MEVRVDADCGNAPRKEQIRDWLVALHKGLDDEVAALLEPEARWEVVGAAVHRASEAARAVAEPPAQALHIRTLISHGNQVAAEGSTVLDGRERRFAHVVTFRGFSKKARIRDVVTFLHPLP